MGTFSDEKYSTYTKYAPKQLREQAPLRPDENQDQPTPSEFTAWVKGPSGRMKNWALLHQMAAVMIFAAVVVLLVLIAKRCCKVQTPPSLQLRKSLNRRMFGG